MSVVWIYAVQSLAWSALGFTIGAAVTQAGVDLTALLRDFSGRRRH